MEILADGLRGGISENTLGGGIPIGYVSAIIHHDKIVPQFYFTPHIPAQSVVKNDCSSDNEDIGRNNGYEVGNDAA